MDMVVCDDILEQWSSIIETLGGGSDGRLMTGDNGYCFVLLSSHLKRS